MIKILTQLFKRTGSCNGCNGQAFCCKEMLLTLRGKNIDSEILFEEAIAVDPKNKIWQKVGETKKGEWIFSCRLLSELGECTDYRGRPKICREFPNPQFLIPKSCSYNFVFNQVVAKRLGQKKLKDLSKKIQHYPFVQEIQEFLRFNTGRRKQK